MNAAGDSFSIRCPACGGILSATSRQIGQQLVCPDCLEEVPVAVPATPAPDAEEPLEALTPEHLIAGAASPQDQAARTGTEPPLAEQEFAVTCPRCGTRLYARSDQIGSQVRCPDCHSLITVKAPPRRRNTGPDLAAQPVEEYAMSDPGERPRYSPFTRDALTEPQLAQLQAQTRAERQLETPVTSAAQESHASSSSATSVPGKHAAPSGIPASPPSDVPELAVPLQYPDPAAPAPLHEAPRSSAMPQAAAPTSPAVSPPVPRTVPGAHTPGPVGETGKSQRSQHATLRVLLSGLWQMLGAPDFLVRWAVLALGLVALNQLRLLFIYQDRMGTPDGSIKNVFVVLIVAPLSLIIVSAVTAFLLTVLEDTANGYVRITNWPGMVFIDWIGRSFLVLNAIGLTAIPLFVIYHVFQFLHLPAPFTLLWLSLLGNVILPVVLLSMFDGDSMFSPLTPRVAQAIGQSATVSLDAYLVSLAAWLAGAAAVSWLLRAESWMGALAVAVFLLILTLYFRLLGRFAACVVTESVSLAPARQPGEPGLPGMQAPSRTGLSRGLMALALLGAAGSCVRLAGSQNNSPAVAGAFLVLAGCSLLLAVARQLRRH